MLTLLTATLRGIAKHWREAVLVSALLAGALFLHSWRASRDAAEKLAATLSAAQRQIDSAASQEKQTDAQLSAQLAQIAALKQQVQTPQQAAAAILKALPPLPAPITLTMSAGASPQKSAGATGASVSPAGAASNSSANSTSSATPPAATLPSAPSPATTTPPAIATIPQQDLKPLYDYIEDCRATAADRDAARKDLSDAQTQITALTTQRDAAVTAAKGGKFWTRVRRNAKWFAIGAGVGGVAVLAARH
jgi:hypothetical protein